MKSIAKSLSSFKIQNLILQSPLKVQLDINDKPRKVTDFHFCRSQPKKRNAPYIAGLSRSALKLLDLEYQAILQDPLSAEFLSGSKLLLNSKPICSNYCGHQFGVWAQQLGDGRAHILGSYINSQNNIYELQLKGSGTNPFSRHADGNSVVSSALRQFLISQAMVGLGVPTTRAASLVIAEQPVKRDPFYNGCIRIQKAAVVLRLSPSFLRFGSFQICNQTAQCRKPTGEQNRKMIKDLADYLIKYNYPHLLKEDLEMDPYQALFRQIVQKTAKLVAKWQSIGFVHGVLNTDNMSMLSITIDYGPFGFIDYFSKDFVSNATDDHQRYSYRQQPNTVKWNLMRLAQAFDCLVPVGVLKQFVRGTFQKVFSEEYYNLMSNKLGVQKNEDNNKLIDQLIDVMHEFSTNFTNTFRILSEQEINIETAVKKLIYQSCPIEAYRQNISVHQQLMQIPPSVVEQIASKDQGFNLHFISEQKARLEIFKRLATISNQQYEKLQREKWAKWLQKYLKLQRNTSIQQKVNPYYTLRNDVANRIHKQLLLLSKQKQPEFLDRILRVFQNPYKQDPWFSQKYWEGKCQSVKLTCSS